MKHTLNKSPSKRESPQAAYQPLVATRPLAASPTQDSLSDRFVDERIGVCRNMALIAKDKDTTIGMPE